MFTLFSDKRYLKPEFIGMEHILRLSNIFEIFKMVIKFFTVYMIYLIFRRSFTNKCHSYQFCSFYKFWFPMFTQLNICITIVKDLICHNSILRMICYSFKSSDYTRFRNFIKSFVSYNWFPVFHINPQIKRLCSACLEVTVGLLTHTRSLILDMKNPSPLSKNSIA